MHEKRAKSIRNLCIRGVSQRIKLIEKCKNTSYRPCLFPVKRIQPSKPRHPKITQYNRDTHLTYSFTHIWKSINQSNFKTNHQPKPIKKIQKPNEKKETQEEKKKRNPDINRAYLKKRLRACRAILYAARRIWSGGARKAAASRDYACGASLALV